MQRVLLASASPRRRELLRSLGLECATLVTDIDETLLPDESALAYVERIARAKLERALATWNPSLPTLVLAADTTVNCDAELLGKPVGPEQALQFLTRLSNRSHVVRTSFVLGLAGPTAQRTGSDIVHQETVSTEVHFRALTETEMHRYIATGEPFDKAGGYGIQGAAAGFVRALHGSYTNVVGLPLAEVADALARVVPR
jgi:septum formation protein